MKTYKDVIFAISVIVWLLAGFLAIVFDWNIHIVNIICLSAFGLLTTFKVFYRKFGLWLETPLNNKK